MPAAPDPRQRAWARFVVSQALLLQRIEAAFAAAGLPPLAWYDVLWVLESTEGGKMRMHDLARKAVVSRSNVTRLTDRMEKAGLVARSDCPEDGRGTVCELTGAGRKMRGRMWPVYKKHVDALFGRHLGVREAQRMAEALERIIAAARAADRSE